MTHFRRALAGGIAMVCLAACSAPEHNGSSSADGGAAGAASGADAGAVGEAGATNGVVPQDALPFLPSNVRQLPSLASVADVMITKSGCDLYGESGEWSCLEAGSFAHDFVEYPSGDKVALFVVKSLRVEAGAIVKTHERLPIIVVALEDLTVLGSIEVVPGTAGGGLNEAPYTDGQGSGGGFRGSVSQGRLASGQGASFCGLGGRNQVMLGSGQGLPREAYGFPESSPLIGGSSGGTGIAGESGAGGGAIQLVAGGKLTLAKGASITAPGAGGGAGLAAEPATGGGSGGAILLEAASFDLQGSLAANGGGGGQGLGADGADGSADDTAAPGGAAKVDGTVKSRGGDGGAGESINGADGTIDGNMNPGSGGGGVGRIRINVHGPLPDLSRASISPATTTDCFSIAKL